MLFLAATPFYIPANSTECFNFFSTSWQHLLFSIFYSNLSKSLLLYFSYVHSRNQVKDNTYTYTYPWLVHSRYSWNIISSYYYFSSFLAACQQAFFFTRFLPVLWFWGQSLTWESWKRTESWKNTKTFLTPSQSEWPWSFWRSQYFLSRFLCLSNWITWRL